MKNDCDKSNRLLSLDCLRGLDMLMIMGFSGIVLALCKAFGWGADCALARQFAHVEWNGFRLEDAIFPLFLFLSGVSWPFSLASQRAKGFSTRRIALRCVKRGAVLFLLGLVYGGLLAGTVRMGSVLGRIGMAWTFAALLALCTTWRTWLACAFALPIGYWLLLYFVPAPDAATLVVPEKLAFVRDFGDGPFSIVGNLSGWLDRTIRPGVLSPYAGIADNQSILGVIPATATALFGVLTGTFVQKTRTSWDGAKRAAALAAAGLALVGAGLLVANCFGAASMPINKKLWSASFTFVVGGGSMALFALFHWLVDVRGWTKWTFFFRVIGMNSITIYLAQRFIPFHAINGNFFGGVAGLLPPAWGSVLLSVTYVAVTWTFLYFLYRKNTFLRV